MKVDNIRKKYLDFFKKKGHKVYDSAPLVPNDPTILFTVAGMVPFKPFFLGTKVPSSKRAASSQRCIRTNDIDIIGTTRRHATCFEMLGNFSFGDYFKKEAIEWLWEFVTEELGIDKDKLIVTVYEEDEESYNIWKNDMGIPEDKLKRCDKDNNFWETGENGPCGPCSEIYYAFNGTNNFDPDSDDFIEVGNAVFTQYNKVKGELVPLPKQNIDTGLGLERLACVLQEVDSVYDIDVFIPLKKKIEELAKKRDAIKERVVIDHLKAIAFLIFDSVLPSNEKRGYVLRRVIRKSVKYAKELGIGSLHALIPFLVETYPELKSSEDHIMEVVKKEEERFNEVLDKGIFFANEEINIALKAKESILKSDVVFKLYDTYGFPFELTKELADKANIRVNKEEFEKRFEEHKELSRSSANFKEDVISSNKVDNIFKKYGETIFVGYDKLEEKAKVIEVFNSLNDVIEVVFDKTSFYAESGGQVGDKGLITSKNFKGEVIDVQKHLGVFIHFVKPIEGFLKKDDECSLKVNEDRRNRTKANHSATHLLHAAVKKVLGDSVSQAGSYVDHEKLRLDLTIGRAITDEEIKRIENIVNVEILKNISIKTISTNMDEAKKMGALAYFEDKYGDLVRVVSVSSFSVELCGGTHANTTGEIGLFKILFEKSLSSNTRRIEAATGLEVLKILNSYEESIENISNMLKVPKNTILDRVKKELKEKQELKMKIGNLTSFVIKSLQKEEINKGNKIKNIPLVEIVLDGENEVLDKSNTSIKSILDNYILFTIAKSSDIFFSISLSKNISNKIKAGNLLKKGLIAMDKNGGGGPEFAKTKLNSIEEADKLKEILKREIEDIL